MDDQDTAREIISIHALREEGDRIQGDAGDHERHFYPRPPRGGRRHLVHLLDGGIDISIHALREEGDLRGKDGDAYDCLFLSTPSARRATRPPSTHSTTASYFYPRPPRGGRLDKRTGRELDHRDFYPRPPRGGRPVRSGYGSERSSISIHALREEGDLAFLGAGKVSWAFLSTPSARRATNNHRKNQSQTNKFLSTPSARRATVR